MYGKILTFDYSLLSDKYEGPTITIVGYDGTKTVLKKLDAVNFINNKSDLIVVPRCYGHHLYPHEKMVGEINSKWAVVGEYPYDELDKNNCLVKDCVWKNTDGKVTHTLMDIRKSTTMNLLYEACKTWKNIYLDDGSPYGGGYNHDMPEWVNKDVGIMIGGLCRRLQANGTNVYRNGACVHYGDAIDALDESGGYLECDGELNEEFVCATWQEFGKTVYPIPTFKDRVIRDIEQLKKPREQWAMSGEKGVQFDERKAAFCYRCFLMGAKPGDRFVWAQEPNATTTLTWYWFYDHDLGMPKADYYPIADGKVLDREFHAGCVRVYLSDEPDKNTTEVILR